MSKVLVNFIQDRSGSMQAVWEETLSGFKKFVQDLRAGAANNGVEYLFSLTTFDTLVETPVAIQPIGSVDVDVLAQHGPRGSTALYDAVGSAIQNTHANRHGADKVIVVIVTDGFAESAVAAASAATSAANASSTVFRLISPPWSGSGMKRGSSSQKDRKNHLKTYEPLFD